jgi:predicted GIY-YIG superfamily endonuclease
MADEEDPWSFYIIQNQGCTYAGVSPDPVKRLRKHNGEIGGGAKYTLSKGPGWTHVCLVHGFHNKIQALQFEWAVKHVAPRDAGGLANRLVKLFTVFNKTHWTSKSPEASTVTLQLEWKIADLPPSIKALTLPAYVSQAYVSQAYVSQAYVSQAYVSQAYVSQAYVSQAAYPPSI